MKQAESARMPRRKPAQARARATAAAIRQAFVRLLVEQGYEEVTIRQVILLAGVGTGSFYEYFSSKEALAAVCIHLSVKEIAACMRACVAANRNAPLPERVDALLEAEFALPLGEPEQWAALLQVERKVSDIEAFRHLYGEFVALWAAALSGPDWPAEVDAAEAARTAHVISYGLVSQTLLTAPLPLDPPALLRQLRCALHGYLSVLAPRAYRLFRFEA